MVGDNMGTMTYLKTIVEKTLSSPLKCYGHCNKQGVLRFLSGSKRLIACFTCPSGYVSRIVTYGKIDLDLAWFRVFLSETVKEMGEVTDYDIRIATRHPWDLGIEGEAGEVVLKQAYWTQNYGRTKSIDSNRTALFLCSRCSSFYHQPVTNEETLCDRCRS